jgi:hypothetical protein
MDIVIVDFQVFLRNPIIFSIEFAPDGFSPPKVVFHAIVYEFTLIDDHCIDSPSVQNCHVQSLCLIDFDSDNYVFISNRIDFRLC